jgi:hypothetical protein
MPLYWRVTTPGRTNCPFFFFCLGLIDVGSEESVILSVEMTTAYCRRPSNHLLWELARRNMRLNALRNVWRGPVTRPRLRPMPRVDRCGTITCIHPNLGQGVPDSGYSPIRYSVPQLTHGLVLAYLDLSLSYVSSFNPWIHNKFARSSFD